MIRRPFILVIALVAGTSGAGPDDDWRGNGRGPDNQRFATLEGLLTSHCPDIFLTVRRRTPPVRGKGCAHL